MTLAPHRCIICGELGPIALSLRARKPRSANAVWAPNLDAYLCHEHANAGIVAELTLRAGSDGRMRATTTGPQGSVQMVLIIGASMRESPGQTSLL